MVTASRSASWHIVDVEVSGVLELKRLDIEAYLQIIFINISFHQRSRVRSIYIGSEEGGVWMAVVCCLLSQAVLPSSTVGKQSHTSYLIPQSAMEI
jgi:hypothetical protein